MWYGDTVLKVAFPTLFSLAHAKDAFVANNLEFLGGSNQWNVNFSREVHDSEAGVFTSFLQLLHLVIVRRDHEDNLC